MKAPLPSLGDYVWIAHTWQRPVVYHSLRQRLAPDVEITRRVWLRAANRYEEHTAVIPSWAFTVCGQLTAHPVWEPGWSDTSDPPRFAVGQGRGDDLPIRLLNPAECRPCRRCYADA